MKPEIRTLAEGELISEPGFYNITLDRHHSQPCDGPSVTSGVLRTMELMTPADVWAFSQLNPDRYEKPETDALRLGRAMAAFVEGGLDEVAKHYLVLSKDKPNRPTKPQIAAFEKNGFWSDAAKKGADYWAKIDADGRVPLTDDEIKMICEMGQALADDPAAVVLMGGIPEVSMAYQDERTGLWVLSRPDTVSFDGVSSDYKKMSAQGRPFTHRLVDNRISQHGYDMQGALAVDAMTNLTGITPEFWIIAQSDKPPYHVIPRQIDEEDLALARFRNQRALTRFAECLESGRWPGPAEDIAAYQRPEWLREQILEQMQMEGTAP